MKFSKQIECYRKGTITCWYHGWTYNWDNGELCDIITNPSSALIGKHRLKVYPVQEAKGLIFVFVGDIAPPELASDVPPGFLDEGMAIHGKRRSGAIGVSASRTASTPVTFSSTSVRSWWPAMTSLCRWASRR